MTDRTELPAGMTLKPVQTEAAGYSYEVEVVQADSLQAILEAYKAEGKNGEEIILAIWNAGNEQGGKQGQKTPVREAAEALAKLRAVPEDAQDEAYLEKLVAAEAALTEAVTKHRDNARQFIQGAPRGGGGQKHESGLTQKKRTELGTAVALKMAMKGGKPLSEAEMGAILTELGIDPEQLGS